jgi:hypothetical protein
MALTERSRLCQTVILERKVLIQGCYLLRECLDTVSEIHPTCQCLHILMAYCPFKPLAIICFDCTLHGTTRDAAAPLTVAAGFRAAESTHPPASIPILSYNMGWVSRINKRAIFETEIHGKHPRTREEVEAVHFCTCQCTTAITSHVALH